jgi:DNA-binding NarL/FixJ family response regulator
MKVLVFSYHDEIIERIVSIVSANDFEVFSFQSIDNLKTVLQAKESGLLIYHLGLRTDDEKAFISLQTAFKSQIYTLVLSNMPDPQQAIRLFNHNIRGYSNTYLDNNKLLTALNVIKQGEIWAGAALIQYLLANTARHSAKPNLAEEVESKADVFGALTEREQEIAQKLLSGQQNKIIAHELGITERTVKAHLSAIYKKLQVKNRLALTLKLQQADRRVS